MYRGRKRERESEKRDRESEKERERAFNPGSSYPHDLRFFLGQLLTALTAYSPGGIAPVRASKGYCQLAIRRCTWPAASVCKLREMT